MLIVQNNRCINLKLVTEFNKCKNGDSFCIKFYFNFSENEYQKDVGDEMVQASSWFEFENEKKRDEAFSNILHKNDDKVVWL